MTDVLAPGIPLDGNGRRHVRPQIPRPSVHTDPGCILGASCCCPHPYHDSWECFSTEEAEALAEEFRSDACPCYGPGSRLRRRLRSRSLRWRALPV